MRKITWGNKISKAQRTDAYKKARAIRMKCQKCGKEFDGYVPHQKFCSWECHYQANYKDLEPIEKKARTLSSPIKFGKGKKEFFINLIKNNIGKHCKYCGNMLTLENMSLDHIEPFGRANLRNNKIIQKQLDRPENLQIICKKCNLMKGELPEKKFRKLLKFLDSDLVLRDYLFRKLGQSNMMWSFKRKQ